jgi:hypothetical protein
MHRTPRTMNGRSLRRRLFDIALRAFAPLLCFVVCCGANGALAGGGPENVLLVVNERSWSSLTIANHYIQLRAIPPQNVVYVPWTLDNEQIDAATMREKLLGPVLAEIERRRLGDHIDVIVYSADFPTLISAYADILPGTKLPPPLTPQVSLTGATFLHQRFMAKQPEYLLFKSNGYFRPGGETEVPASHGFRSWYGWDEENRLLEAGGRHYYLAAMLGCTSGRGNSTAEVITMLERSAAADYSRPDGTIYFAVNSDVRSTTRKPLFAPAIRAIEAEGAKAATFAGMVPKKRDVAGAMIGSSDFSLENTKLLPGAIGEHLTSHGGMMNEGASQTPITDWVRAGTSLTSGAVAEPYAVPFKFPSAYMHLHYVRGCTAAEAYYQSISGPYQMLVLGDPLCKPWARKAKIELVGFDNSKPLAGRTVITPRARFDGSRDGGGEPARFELYLDGLLITACAPGESFGFDVDRLADGRHELRITAVGPEPIEMRSSVIAPFDTADRIRTVALKRFGSGPIVWGEPLTLDVEAAGLPEGAKIAVAQGTRGVALLDRPGRVVLAPHVFGAGPVTLQAFALTDPRRAPSVVSAPLELTIEPSRPLPKLTDFDAAKLRPGVSFKINDKPAIGLLAATFDEGLKVLAAGDAFEFSGYFDVAEEGLYQFHLRHALQLDLAIDDRPILKTDAKQPTLDYVPIALAAGRHKLTLTGKLTGPPQLDIRFGLRGVQRLKPSALKH